MDDSTRDTHFEVAAQLLYHDLEPYLRDDIRYSELERLLTRRSHDLIQHGHRWRARKTVADIPPLTNWPDT